MGMGQSKTKQSKTPKQYYPEYTDLADWGSQFLLKHQFLPEEVRELDSDTKSQYIGKLSDTLCAYLLEKGADARQLLMMDERSIALAASNIMEMGDTLLQKGADINQVIDLDERQVALAALYFLDGRGQLLSQRGIPINQIIIMNEQLSLIHI